MMDAAQWLETEDLVWFKGKGSNSLSTGPWVFILNSGDVYIHNREQQHDNTHTHVTSACIHYSPLCFQLTLKIALHAVRVLYVQQHNLRQYSDIFLSQCDQIEMTVTSNRLSLCYSLSEETHPTNKQINVKLRRNVLLKHSEKFK